MIGRRLSVASAFLMDMSVGGRTGRVRPRWLLWDLENCPPPWRRAPEMLHAMLVAAGPVDLVVAATASPGQLARYEAELGGSGVVFLLGFPGPDGADQTLLLCAARCPAGEMVVASDDGSFVQLAGAGHRLVVLSRQPGLVSQLLRERAVKVVPFTAPSPTRMTEQQWLRRHGAEEGIAAQPPQLRVPARRLDLDPRAERRWWQRSLQEWADAAGAGDLPPARVDGDGMTA